MQWNELYTARENIPNWQVDNINGYHLIDLCKEGENIFSWSTTEAKTISKLLLESSGDYKTLPDICMKKMIPKYFQLSFQRCSCSTLGHCFQSYHFSRLDTGGLGVGVGGGGDWIHSSRVSAISNMIHVCLNVVCFYLKKTVQAVGQKNFYPNSGSSSLYPLKALQRIVSWVSGTWHNEVKELWQTRSGTDCQDRQNG